MSGRYCAINSPRGSRWGPKSRDWRWGDFCPHRWPSGKLIVQYRPPMSFCFYPIFCMCKICILLEAWYFLKRAKDDIYWPRYSVSTKLILPLWWRHNIYLWRKNCARRHARAKHYECVVFENCTQTARVYSHIICHNKSTHSWASKLTTQFSNFIV